MGLGKSFTMAISSIINNKVRSLLTMLGIIIGIAAVIILVSVMNGLTSEVTSVFSEFGTTSLTTNIQPRPNIEVEPEELYEFADENPDLFNGVSPLVTVGGTFKTPTSGKCKGSFGGLLRYTEIRSCIRQIYFIYRLSGKIESSGNRLISGNGIFRLMRGGDW